MSELLTTGQMIDTLKVGETAVGDVSELGKVIQVIKRESGCIKLYEDGFGERTLMLDGGVVDSVKWRIEPNYVSFYEAMKAYEDDKKSITYHHDSDLKYAFKYENATDQFKKIYFDSISLPEMVTGKWTIER